MDRLPYYLKNIQLVKWQAKLNNVVPGGDQLIGSVCQDS